MISDQLCNPTLCRKLELLRCRQYEARGRTVELTVGGKTISVKQYTLRDLLHIKNAALISPDAMTFSRMLVQAYQIGGFNPWQVEVERIVDDAIALKRGYY